MLIDGPVNGNVPRKFFEPQRWPLSKPTDDRETLAARHGQDFMKRLCGERNEKACFTFKSESPGLIVKVEDAAAKTTLARLA